MDKSKIRKLLDNSYVLTCFNCNGEGAVDQGILCLKPASMCCGGCENFVECKTCSGYGELEPIDDDMLDQFMMLSALDNMLNKFKEVRKTFKWIASEDMASDYELADLDKQIKRYEKLEQSILNEIEQNYG